MRQPCAPLLWRLRACSGFVQEKDRDKRQRVRSVLGISDSEADSLQELVEAGQFKLDQEAEAESFF